MERAAEGRPERKTSGKPCRVRNHNQRQAARHRKQRLFIGASELEMRPVGGSATEASDGGVGAHGGKSGGVAPEGTVKTGVKVASAAGQHGARPRPSSPVPTTREIP